MLPLQFLDLRFLPSIHARFAQDGFQQLSNTLPKALRSLFQVIQHLAKGLVGLAKAKCYHYLLAVLQIRSDQMQLDFTLLQPNFAGRLLAMRSRAFLSSAPPPLVNFTSFTCQKSSAKGPQLLKSLLRPCAACLKLLSSLLRPCASLLSLLAVIFHFTKKNFLSFEIISELLAHPVWN